MTVQKRQILEDFFLHLESLKIGIVFLKKKKQSVPKIWVQSCDNVRFESHVEKWE